ncbi:MAG: hypothetical protein F2916_05450 [Actinobacteria bacterium]|nr:hypothetical protein [Actinomycetota bacterium]
MHTSQSRRLRRLFAVVSILAASAVVPHSIASAVDPDPTADVPSSYKDFDQFPACSATVTTFCVASWGVDLNNDGVFETPDASLNISFKAWIYNIKDYKQPGLVYELEVNRPSGVPAFQELAPEIPVGTAATFAINTGAFRPSPELFASSDVNYIDVNQVDGNWITTGVIRTYSYTAAIGCEDDCNNPTSTYDYKSYAQGVLNYESPGTLRDSKKGMWVSSNASVTGGLVFDQTALTFSVDLLGPAKRPDGTDNILKYSAFVPDTFIQFAYGTTADVLATSLSTTRTDSGVTTKVTSTATRVTAPIPGLLITMPDIRLYGTAVASQGVHTAALRYSTAPTLKIKPKTSLLRAPTIRRASRASSTKVKVVGASVSGATSYQAMCTKGIVTKFATAKTPTVTVKNLTKGKWSCKIRGVKKVGGRWSDKLNIKL